jgi:hypothetical protein
VPASTPGRFGVEFVDRKTTSTTNYLLEANLWSTPPNPGPPVIPGIPANIDTLPGSLGSNVRFGHLLNFQHAHGSWWQQWYTDRYDPSATPPVIPPFVSLDLANFLNFVNVPSRFVGTRDWYNAGNKFYSYSRFREPGKVNLNTLTAAGFAALLENRTYDIPTGSSAADAYEAFDVSRGAYDKIFGNFMPFGRPFRGSSATLLNVDAPYESSVDATLMQSERIKDETDSLDFGLDTGKPAFAPMMNASPNSYMALEGIQRLSDMTTTRSNVFAIWLTLGYFEVEKLPTTGTFTPTLGISYDLANPDDKNRFDAIYPDGYMLKKEVGLETGEIKRHRAFYIIDRSIPFGYRRGQKLNSEDAIVLKRFIE